MTDSLDSILDQLEQCAGREGSATILDAHQAQLLLEEIYTLRMGPGVSLDLPDGRSIPLVPERPDRDGQQFADREGHVWTWTPWDRLTNPADVRASRGFNMMVREEDGAADVALTWEQTWFDHGPLWRLSNLDAFAQVVLRCETVIQGRRVEARSMVDEFMWEAYPSEAHEWMKADLLRRLAEGIVEKLNPKVTVQRQPRWIREWEKQRGPRFAPPQVPKATP